VAQEQVFNTLKARLRPICHRTLRRQVLPYIKYTRRLPLVQEFTPNESEDRLYNLVSDYLQRDNLQALPASQRTLMTLVLRKLLASSSFAIAGALESIAARLADKLRPNPPPDTLVDQLDTDYEALDETAEEWGEDSSAEPLSDADRSAIERELADLRSFAKLATSIEHNAKGKALLTALDIAFAKARKIGAAEKAIIFTESRRTQLYLLRVLAGSSFAEGIVLFNGSNTDPRSREIYARWVEGHQDTDRITGSRTADMRSALIDYFRDEGRILIATEAGAEGINLQFCSLVVNYDLPWNPQRIEQRIGRCHRYGQQHDVVVVNFLNRNNAADQRVFELLSEKFQLFEGVFGASDEVLGAIESGVDFEKRIATIYQRCRHPSEIQTAFDALQNELGTEIDASMARTRQQLFEHFDDEVREKLRVRNEDSKAYLNRFERILMQLTRHELGGHAEFVSDSSFRLLSQPTDLPGDGLDAIPLGLYELPRRSGEARLYRMGHPLAGALVARARTRPMFPARLEFVYDDHDGKISALEPLRGCSGSLAFSLFTVESLDRAEDHLIVSATLDDGPILEDDVAKRLLTLPGRALDVAEHEPSDERLGVHTQQRQADIQRGISERNARHFEAEADKLDAWADDLKVGLEREIKDLDRQIKETRRAATAALTLEGKLAGQKQIKALEVRRNERRRSLFEAQDRIDQDREQLIVQIEGKLQQSISSQAAFSVRWKLR